MVLGLVLISGYAQGASFTYNTESKTIRAGVIAPGASLAFYYMDQRLDLKPTGWNFINPIAASAPAGSTDYIKSTAAYWAVNIANLSFGELTQFDVLFLPLTGAFPSNPDEKRMIREKLRKFVDAGGVLWIENDGGSLDDSFFLGRVSFGTGSAAQASAVNPAHPLVCRPHNLTWDDFNKLGRNNKAGENNIGLSNQDYFANIIVSGANPIVRAAEYGSGYVVVSAEAITLGIVNPMGINFAQTEDLKLAYNIVAWGSEHNTFHKNARRSGYSFNEIGGNLATLWAFQQAPCMVGSSPAILDDMIYFVDVNSVLHAVDLSSVRDRDGDGQSDDGTAAYRDQSKGAPYDEVWQAPIGMGTVSSVTATYIPSTGGFPLPAIFVAGSSGTVKAYNGRDGSLIRTYSPSTGGFVPFTGTVPAPTYIDGSLFLGDGNGTLHWFDVRSGAAWQSTNTGLGPSPALGSPVAGFVRDPASNTMDQVVYLPMTNNAEAIKSFPIRVFNEVLTTNAHGSGVTTFTTRNKASNMYTDPSTWELHYGNGLGVIPYSAGGNSNGGDVSNPGKFVVNISPASQWRGSTITADYRIDPSTTFAPRPSAITTKQPTATNTSVKATPALSAQDILFFSDNNEALYAVQETGIKNTRANVKWRWTLSNPMFGASGAVVVGSPAASKDMVYFAVNSGGKGYIVALKADPIFTISIKNTVGGSVMLDSRRPPVITQFDPMNPTGSITMSAGQYTVDYPRGRITINNFRTGSDANSDFSASQNVNVHYYMPDEAGGGEGDFTVQAFNGWGPDKTQNWNNMVWCKELPGMVTTGTSPSVMGDILYIPCGNTLAAINVLNKKTWMYPGPFSAEPIGTITSTVAGSHGVLALPTNRGLWVLHNPSILVADGNRIAEVDTGGTVLWSCDSTSSYVSTSGPVMGQVNVPFNRPAVARKADTGGIIVADTGNNRVVQMDAGGNIIWQITSFKDTGLPSDLNYPNAPMLPSGTPLTLNSPMDVSTWAQPEDPANPNSPPEYHFLIADSGNFRVVEVVARRNASGVYENQLRWVSKTASAEGKRYKYTSVRRVQDPVTREEFNICSISNATIQNKQPVEGNGGALAKLAISGSKDGLVASAIDVIHDDAGIIPDYHLFEPKFFSRTYTDYNPTNAEVKYEDVYLDARGVHVAIFINRNIQELRHYTVQDHMQRTNRPLHATYAQLMPNGNVLVTNKAMGTGATGVSGEIFELKWDRHPIIGHFMYNIAWSISQNPKSNSYGLRQPLSAERQPY